jgi:hypothetical protein
MKKDERDALEVLKFELNFLEKGGYGSSPREPWRPRFIFEDSPTCMNYDCKENPAPCSDCVLMHWVPPESREEKVPCRHIPLSPTGETLDSLYRWGDQQEIEEAMRNWLRPTIENLERERKSANLSASGPSGSSDDVTRGTPLYEKFHPKCANPACPTAFHWLGGGKFFRFRPEQRGESSSADSPANEHRVKHFWLCERCSHIFTLVYQNELGVLLKVLSRELPSPDGRKELSATSRG